MPTLKQTDRSTGDDEAERIGRARRGDAGAFEALYRDHVASVYGLCLRMTGHAPAAEDLTQETFVNAWRGLAGYEGRSRFSTWLHRIAVNAVLTERRAPRGRGEAAPDGDVGAMAMEPAEEPWRESALPADLEQAIAALPPGARDVLVLHGIYGYSHAEAAELLGVAAGTCKAQLHRARRLLRARLERETRA